MKRLNRFERDDEKPFEAVARSRSSTSAPTSCSRARSCDAMPTRPRQATARLIRCARSAGRCRTESWLWWLRRCGGRRQGEAPAPRQKDQDFAPAEKLRLGPRQRGARPLPRPARRRERGGVLPVYGELFALQSGRIRGGERRGRTPRRRSARYGARARGARRASTTAATPEASRARALLARRGAADPARADRKAELIARVPASSAGPVRATRRAASAANRRSSSTTSRAGRSRRCRAARGSGDRARS